VLWKEIRPEDRRGFNLYGHDRYVLHVVFRRPPPTYGVAQFDGFDSGPPFGELPDQDRCEPSSTCRDVSIPSPGPCDGGRIFLFLSGNPIHGPTSCRYHNEATDQN